MYNKIHSLNNTTTKLQSTLDICTTGWPHGIIPPATPESRFTQISNSELTDCRNKSHDIICQPSPKPPIKVDRTFSAEGRNPEPFRALPKSKPPKILGARAIGGNKWQVAMTTLEWSEPFRLEGLCEEWSRISVFWKCFDLFYNHNLLIIVNYPADCLYSAAE